MTQNANSYPDYKSAVNGRFTGILRWPQFELLWQTLGSDSKDWYVYEPEAGDPPGEPLSERDLKQFLAKTETYLRELCTSECCGAVYADSVSDPGFIKIYNPRLMGGCGMGRAPLPQWIISRRTPISLIEGQQMPQKQGVLGRLSSGRF